MELGRIDIYTEGASMLLHQLAILPQVGHLKVVYHVFACYLNKHDKSRIIFDPTDPIPVTPKMSKPDWSFVLPQRNGRPPA
jgi:hypothetical protein